jgi:hypothetical protein
MEQKFDMGQRVQWKGVPAVFGSYGPLKDDCSVVLDGENKYTIVKAADVNAAPIEEKK